MTIIKRSALTAGTLAVLMLAAIAPAQATTGPGCLRVVNVPYWDVLNIRARPSASSAIVGRINPRGHGVISLRGNCIPYTTSWPNRWCPIAHYSGYGTEQGWVKARYVRDSDCP